MRVTGIPIEKCILTMGNNEDTSEGERKEIIV